MLVSARGKEFKITFFLCLLLKQDWESSQAFVLYHNYSKHLDFLTYYIWTFISVPNDMLCLE